MLLLGITTFILGLKYSIPFRDMRVILPDQHCNLYYLLKRNKNGRVLVVSNLFAQYNHQ